MGQSKSTKKLLSANEGVPGEAPVLHLNLVGWAFERILSGEKKEEYREMKPYWDRIFDRNIRINRITNA